MAPFRFWFSEQHQESQATSIAYDSGKDASTPLQIKPMSPTSLLDVAGQAIRSPALASALQGSAHAGPRDLTAAFWHALEGPLLQHLITSPARTSQGPVLDIHELGSHVQQLLRNLSDPPCSLSTNVAEDVPRMAFAALHAINVLPFPQAAKLKQAIAARHAQEDPAAGVFFEVAMQALNNILSMAASHMPTHPEVYTHDGLLQTPSLDTTAPGQKQAAPQVPQDDAAGEWHSLPDMDLPLDYNSLSPQTSLPGDF